MKELLYALSGYHKQEEPNWIIWGAGTRGKLLLEYIKKLCSSNIYFADNAMTNGGKMIEGVLCLSEEQVKKMADDSIVLLSPYRNVELYNNLKNRFLYVVPDIVLEILMYYPKAHGFDLFMPLGHYYSLYPDMAKVEKNYNEIFQVEREIRNIDFNVDMQYNLLEEMKTLSVSIPKWGEASGDVNGKYRYKTDATSFGVPDATCLHLMLRILKPKRLIEVGSGWSSAVMLDTNEWYLDGSMEITFIEPYPVLLNRILRLDDTYELKESGLENIEMDYFEKLEAGDVLFIDSTHVSKIGSDVNYLFFEILPRLKNGVYIHFHDIFYPFEYPHAWLDKGFIWNELYLLRSFLMDNKNYEIVFFFDYLSKIHTDKVQECLHMKSPSCGSFWLRKS